MSNLKLNGNGKSNTTTGNFNDLPDLDGMAAPSNANTQNKNQSTQSSGPIIKEKEVEHRKMFANKKANIALIIAGVAIVAAIVAALIYINI